MTKVFLTGGGSGIGFETARLLRERKFDVVSPLRNELDLLDTDAIERLDLSNFDIVISCAGINTGTYLGFTNNSSKNQTTQVLVNMVAPMLLLKQYVKCRDHGQYIFVSSQSIDTPFKYNVFNASSKAGLRHAMNTLRQELPKFTISEVCPGKTKTNMLKNNYNGAKTDQEIEKEYMQSEFLLPSEVATAILNVISSKEPFVRLLPHDKLK